MVLLRLPIGLSVLSLPFHSIAAYSLLDSQQPLHDSGKPLKSSPLLSLHKSLVNIPSISNHEHAVGLYLKNHLESLNYTVELQPVDPIPFSLPSTATTTTIPQRYNLLAYPGTKRQTPVLLSSHIDTVPPFYSYHVHPDGSIWGRGTVDAKACVATQLTAAEELFATASISRDDVSFLFVDAPNTSWDRLASARKSAATACGAPTISASPGIPSSSASRRN